MGIQSELVRQTDWPDPSGRNHQERRPETFHVPLLPSVPPLISSILSLILCSPFSRRLSSFCSRFPVAASARHLLCATTLTSHSFSPDPFYSSLSFSFPSLVVVFSCGTFVSGWFIVLICHRWLSIHFFCLFHILCLFRTCLCLSAFLYSLLHRHAEIFPIFSTHPSIHTHLLIHI